MDNKEKIIKNFDNIIGTNKFNNIDKTKFPLLIKIFEQFREDVIPTTEEYENLKKDKLQLLEKINKSFNNEQKKIFEEYWEIENKMISMTEENIFIFGYLVKDELEIEK